MGSVFLAERDDGEFSMQVALKIVRQSIADSEVISRFKQERQILASLHHPNIAVLHDGGLSDKGEPFLAMEYIEGQTLIDYCHDKALSINDRLFLFLKICSAVAYAHRNLVVHRDIKPTNILVTAEGEPKLLDFGLAKAFESDSTQTLTAYRAFTPAYASPEQILGKPVSTGSDQYSLGVVLFELLTGTKPFDFDGMAVDQMILSLQANEVRSPLLPDLSVVTKPGLPRHRSWSLPSSRPWSCHFGKHPLPAPSGTGQRVDFRKYDNSPIPCSLRSLQR
ncbi:MAG: serine/threonine protein kinase [Acidobacteria bacterium]|nr:serine/threonine protein kinase [Acidobacteriota bacterium]